jgi:hypothetical protein
VCKNAQDGLKNMTIIKSTSLAGYEVVKEAGSMSNVEGVITISDAFIPGVSSSVLCDVALDGKATNGIRAGMEIDVDASGKMSCFAFYKIGSGSRVKVSNFAVTPTDGLFVQINFASGKAVFNFENCTTGQKTSVSQACVVPGSSAGWFVESPTSKLSNFGDISFSQVQLTYNGVAAFMSHFSLVESVMYTSDLSAIRADPGSYWVSDPESGAYPGTGSSDGFDIIFKRA